MIVNHDAANAQKLRIEFNPGFRIRELTPPRSGVETSGEVINTTQDLRIERRLNPGGYLIFKLETKTPA